MRAGFGAGAFIILSFHEVLRAESVESGGGFSGQGLNSAMQLEFVFDRDWLGHVLYFLLGWLSILSAHWENRAISPAVLRAGRATHGKSPVPATGDIAPALSVIR